MCANVCNRASLTNGRVIDSQAETNQNARLLRRYVYEDLRNWSSSESLKVATSASVYVCKRVALFFNRAPEGSGFENARGHVHMKTSVQTLLARPCVQLSS